MFTGLPPTEGMTAQTQRDYFVNQMQRLLGLRGIKSDDWGDIFWQLARGTQSGQVVLVFDEINWIGSLDITFLGKLKSAWDLHFKNNPELLMILSGSMSSWIDKNILSSTGFMGRLSLELTLDELPLSVCDLFWGKKSALISPYEKFKLLSVMGGVPRYLEEIDPDLSAEQNIYRLAFQKGGLLVEEFERIFSDLFSRRSLRYKEIIKQLVAGNATLDQICDAIELEKSGVISGYLEDLVETGYVARDYTWNIKNGKESSLCKFRLKDNYLRFYLKYIEPKRAQIEKNLLIATPPWSTIMGLQFENLVVNHPQYLHQFLKLDPQEIVYENPYFQRQSKTYLGCQIDYLIQSKFNTLHLCEIKFSKDPIGLTVVKEVQQKIERIVKAKHFSFRPVLIHINGVTDELIESEFFSSIVDFGQLLKH